MLYDRDDIEQRLIQDLEGLICKWQLQDLVCSNCRLVKAEDLRANCAKCTGNLKTVLEREQYNRQIHVLANLADYFRMELLREATAFVQQMG
jgi:DNA polymerase epsilon subunit 1